jgi:hypothetical protein
LLFLLALAADARVELVGKLYELDETGSFLLHVFVANSLVLFFHVPTLITILGFSWIILIILRKVSPGVEIVPILIELEYMLDRGGLVS